MATMALIVLLSASAVAVRVWLTHREAEIDFERDYRAPPVIANMPNVPG